MIISYSKKTAYYFKLGVHGKKSKRDLEKSASESASTTGRLLIHVDRVTVSRKDLVQAKEQMTVEEKALEKIIVKLSLVRNGRNGVLHIEVRIKNLENVGIKLMTDSIIASQIRRCVIKTIHLKLAPKCNIATVKV